MSDSPITKEQSERSWDMGRPWQVQTLNGRKIPPDEPEGELRAAELYELEPEGGGMRFTGILWLSAAGDVGFLEAVKGAAAPWHKRLLEMYKRGTPDGVRFFEYWSVGNGIAWGSSPTFTVEHIAELRARLAARMSRSP
jgi:hypothetical protein